MKEPPNLPAGVYRHLIRAGNTLINLILWPVSRVVNIVLAFIILQYAKMYLFSETGTLPVPYKNTV